MAIRDADVNYDTITKGHSALNFFTDRNDLIRLFLTYLNEGNDQEKILYLYGDGGQGKSILMQFLQKYCCKELTASQWRGVKRVADPELKSKLLKIATASAVPYTHLDFGGPVLMEENPQEAVSALLMMRRELAFHKITFPLFDFACLWYLHKSHRSIKGYRKSLFPEAEFDLIASLVDLINSTSGSVLSLATQTIKIFHRHFDDHLTLYVSKRGITKERIAAIQEMELRKELPDYLPVLFAEDLNAHMLKKKGKDRVVLFFDTHEALWGSNRDLDDEKRDEWLRKLLTTLELKSGIIVVVAGRDYPRWHQAKSVRIPLKHLEAKHVELFSQKDANEFLLRAGVDDEKLRAAFSRYASLDKDQVHPYYLGLCADVALSAKKYQQRLASDDRSLKQPLTDKGSVLVGSLLQYEQDKSTRYGIRALAACRFFDEAIYSFLGKKLNFLADKPHFDTLKHFSFVRQIQIGGQIKYRLHDLMRRYFQNIDDEVSRKAHQLLEDYYHQRSTTKNDTSAGVEYIYHTNQLDPKEGFNKWAILIDHFYLDGQLEIVRQLLDLGSELRLPDQTYKAEICYFESVYYQTRGDFQEAEKLSRRALGFYNEILQQTPDSGMAMCGVIMVLIQLAQTQHFLSKDEDAVKSIQDALAVHQQAYTHSKTAFVTPSLRSLIMSETPIPVDDDIDIEAASEFMYAVTKINCLKLLAGLVSQDTNHHKAIEFLGEAVLLCDQLLSETNKGLDEYVLALKAGIEHEKGAKYFAFRHLVLAKACFYAALDTIDKAMQASKDICTTYWLTTINIMDSITDIEIYGSEGSDYSRAKDYNEAALKLGQELLEAVPSLVTLYPSLSRVMNNRGFLQVLGGDYQAANKSYTESLRMYDRYLEICGRPPQDKYRDHIHNLSTEVQATLAGNTSKPTGYLETQVKGLTSRVTFWLTVYSTPECKVYLNDVLLGKTPMSRVYTYPTPAADYILRLESIETSHPDHIQHLEIKNGRAFIIDKTFGDKYVSAVFSAYTVQSTPDKDTLLAVDAPNGPFSVLLDGKRVGKTPLECPIEPGIVYRIRLIKKGYKQIKFNLRPYRHCINRVHITLPIVEAD